MIREIQENWNEPDKKQLKRISDEFSICQETAQKYAFMTEDEISSMDSAPVRKKRKTVMDNYINIIYKMLCDKRDPAAIMAYVIKTGYTGELGTLEAYIKVLAKNNFNIRFGRNWAYAVGYPPDIIAIKRSAVLKHITTKNPKIEKDELVAQHLKIIEEKYPVVSSLKEIYDVFHKTIMGKDPDELDSFIDKYKDSALKDFISGIKRDIAPVKNAISRDESSGFVEGNNNKFKLIKRILYGRANLGNLFKKSYVAFKTKSADFELSQLIKKRL